MNKLSYINITTKGCEGWINLFVDNYIFACVDNPYIADKVRKAIDNSATMEDFKDRVDIRKRLDDFIEFAEKTHRFHDADFYRHCKTYIKSLEKERKLLYEYCNQYMKDLEEEIENILYGK